MQSNQQRNHDAYIKEAQTTVYNGIEKTLQTSYMNEKEGEIKNEIEKKCHDQAQALAGKFELEDKLAFQPSTHPSSVIQFEREETEEVYGVKVKKSIASRIKTQLSKAVITNQVKKDFKDKFQREIWIQHIAPQLNKIFNQLDVTKKLKLFLRRHQWIELGDNKLGHVAQEFLINFLSAWFIKSLAYKYSRRDWALNVSTMENFKLTAYFVDNEEVDAFIEGFPYKSYEQSKFYFHNKPALYPSFYQNSKKEISDKTPIMTYTPKRVDILRYMKNADFCDGNDKYVPHKEYLMYCPEYAVYHKDELPQLPDLIRENVKLIYVNIRTEEEPLWILMEKQADARWQLYAPSCADDKTYHYHKHLKSLGEFYPRDLSQIKTNVDNGMEGLKDNENLIWHANLFGRITPCIVRRLNAIKRKTIGFKDIQLEDYLSQTPVSLMYQYFLELSLRDIEEKNGNTEKNENAVKTSPNPGPADVLRLQFNARQPLSEFTVEEQIDKAQEANSYVLDKAILKEIDPVQIIDNYLSDCHFAFINNGDIIQCQGEFGALKLISAFYLGYHVNTTQFIYPKVQRFNKVYNDVLDKSLTIQSVLPAFTDSAYTDDFIYATHIAARNRFLLESAPDVIHEAKTNVKEYKAIQTNTAKALVAFFRKHADAIDLDFINKVIEYNQTWLSQPCQHTNRGKNIESLSWSFMQLAQMGIYGLDVLFNYFDDNSKHKEPTDVDYAPKLSGVFDLNGSMYETPEHYITHFNNRIQAFKEECTPLFTSLGLILPKNMSPDFVIQLITLIKVLHNRSEKNNDEVGEINLFNLDINHPESNRIIETLITLATHEKLLVNVNVPAWNREIYDDTKHKGLKVEYKRLQNLVLANQRAKCNTLQQPKAKVFNEFLESPTSFKTEVVLDLDIDKKRQPFGGDDVSFPLSGQALGVQQQVQQQYEQAVEAQADNTLFQEDAQQQEQQQESTRRSRPIEQYVGDETDCLTRENIKIVYGQLHEKYDLPKTDEDLVDLFNSCVGSHKAGHDIIEKIHPLAMQRILQHRQHFKMGVNIDSLPYGFFVTYSDDTTKSLILCYDENKRLKEESEAAHLERKQRDPFVLHLIPKAIAKPFRGDYRQFNGLLVDQAETRDFETLWRYLACEDGDETRIKETMQYLLQKGVSSEANSASVILQVFEAENGQLLPQDLQKCLSLLSKWAKAQNASSELIELLFNAGSDACLTEANLKAFGQLFNTLAERDTTKKKGYDFWLSVADQILTTFGENHFKIWKKRLLDNSVNWCEYIEENELDAVALSISTLKSSPEHSALWWQCVDKHAESVGHVLYHDLWFAFQRVLQLIENRKLMINFTAFQNYLAHADQFNGKIFLDRLYYVLNAANPQLDSKRIQQHILDNINKIDWRYSGYYYASHYEAYPYYNEEINLKQLNSSTANNDNYAVIWDKNHDHIKDGKLHALRFAAQRMKIRFCEFDKLKLLIETCQPEDVHLLRLFLASIARGVDKIDDSSEKELGEYFANIKKFSGCVNWFNRVVELDKELVSGNIKLSLAGILKIAQVIKGLGLEDKIYALSGSDAINFINTLGRAVVCFANNDDDIKEFITIAANNDAYEHALLTTYPWLLRSDYRKLCNFASLGAWQHPDTVTMPQDGNVANLVQEQLKRFKEQLLSIDLENTKKFPTYDEIKKIYADIAQAGDHAERARREHVSKLIQSGCYIAYQDAAFRPLNPDEVEKVESLFSSQLSSRYQQGNIELFKRLLANHIAVSVHEDPEQHLKALVEHLSKLDNKKYYDELGQILGELLVQANTIPKKYYSLRELDSWISKLHVPKTYDKNHYPVNLLRQVITESIRSDASLINHNLHQLDKSKEILILEQQKGIQKINESTLPNYYKPILVKMIMRNHLLAVPAEKLQESLLKLISDKVDPAWIDATLGLIDHCIEMGFTDEDLQNISALTKTANDYLGVLPPEDKLHALWQSTQIKIIDLYRKGIIDKAEYVQYFHLKDKKQIEKLTENKKANEKQAAQDKNVKAVYILIILTLGLRSRKTCWNDADKKRYEDLAKTLDNFKDEDLKQLATYVSTKPRPTLTELTVFCTSFTTADEVIHDFEAVHQAIGKRRYSVTEKDKTNLLRVLKGIRFKGKGFIKREEQNYLLNLFNYCNAFSIEHELRHLPANQLRIQMHEVVKALASTNDAIAKHRLSARLLAYMREILLRKTGMWANHTQMLDLIYAAIYNDESLIHQMMTGEGKSIITLMRTAYLAMTGHVVDVFSAKSSLSKRDHKKFAPVFDAMGIRHAYITDDSPAKAYHATIENGIGAVNYATIGNFSLHQSTHIWGENENITYDKSKRIAWLDECDHILKFENTQFNYSDNQSGVYYNYDEWVYQIVYDYYSELRDTHALDKLNYTLTRNEHLKELSARLHEKFKSAPDQSTFFSTYMLPALNNDPGATKRRDEQLKYLLSAAHSASTLELDVNYCIQPDKQRLANNFMIDTSFAKVMIANQICPGSTYSDLVQQFLHVRLNKEAASKNCAPNFFVEPETRIALSQNAEYLLKKHYAKLEGCTGTAGNEDILDFYRKVYGINLVVKLPTHEPRKTKYLRPIYVEGKPAQAKAIAERIGKADREQPILITSKNDTAVNNQSKLIKEILNKGDKQAQAKAAGMIVDVNSSGKAESDILPAAGKNGATTISSRMGRGTDIKPDPKIGLYVLRTYPAPPSIVKQENGRQGRNAAEGTVQEIIDFAEIRAQQEALCQNKEIAKRFNEILEKERRHFENKLTKHANKSDKFKWANEFPDDKEKYLITRTVVELQALLEEEAQKYNHQKENLIAALSGQVMDVLQSYKVNRYTLNFKNLRKDWLECRRQIDNAWNARLLGQTGDSDEIYDNFLENVNKEWIKLYKNHPSLGEKLPQFAAAAHAKQDDKIPPLSELPYEHADTSELVTFYQNWIGGIEREFIQPAIAAKQEKTPALKAYLADDGTEKLFNILRDATTLEYTDNKQQQVAQDKCQFIFARLQRMFKDKRGFNVSAGALKSMIYFILNDNVKATVEDKISILESFFNQIWIKNTDPHTLTENDFKKNDRLLKFAMDMMELCFVEGDTPEFIEQFCAVIHEKYWEKFPLLLDHIAPLYKNTKVLNLLMRYTGYADINLLIGLLISQPVRYADKLVSYLSENSENIITNKMGKIIPAIAKIFYDDIKRWKKEENLANYLPDDNDLERLSSDSKAELFSFLSQRMPLYSNQCAEFISELKKRKETKDFKKHILKPLFALPAYLPVDYIGKHLNRSLGQENYMGAKKQIEKMEKAGECFKRALVKRMIVDESSEFKQQRKLEAYVEMQEAINYLEPEAAICFFEHATTYGNIPPDLLVGLAKAYAEKRLHANQLEAAFKVTSQFVQLPDSIKTSLLKTWEEALNIKDLNLNIDVINTYARYAALFHSDVVRELLSGLEKPDTDPENLLAVNMFQKLSDQIRSKSSMDIVGVTEIFENISAFLQKRPKADKSHLGKYILSTYLASSMDATITTRMRAFLEYCHNDKYCNLDPAAYDAILKAWIVPPSSKSETLIKNENDLKEAFEYNVKASRLHTDKNYNKYFDSFHSNKKERQQLMSLTFHNIVKPLADWERVKSEGEKETGNKFKELMFDGYAKLGNQLIKVPAKVGDNKSKRQSMKDCQKEVMQFTQELLSIIQPPFTVPKETNYTHRDHMNRIHNYTKSGEAAEGTPRSNHQKLVMRALNSYNSIFTSKSTQRKIQTKGLIADLKTIGDTTIDFDYYRETMSRIWSTQRTILETDMNTKNNSKGHSRLYDICQQMLLTLAQDCVKFAFSVGEKTRSQYLEHVNDLFNMQLNVNLRAFASRMMGYKFGFFSGKKLEDFQQEFTTAYNAIQFPQNDATFKLNVDSPSVDTLLKLINKYNDVIPKELRYLVDNIDALVLHHPLQGPTLPANDMPFKRNEAS